MKKINVAKFFDDFAIAGRGLLLATKRKDFWVSFLITFVMFNILLNLLASGFSAFKLIFSGNFQVLLEAMTKFEALNVALAILQGVLIAMIVIVMKTLNFSNWNVQTAEKLFVLKTVNFLMTV